MEIEVRPGSKKSLIKKNSEGKIKIYLNVPPVDGKANGELITVLADLFDTPKSLIEIKSGLKSKSKKIKIYYRISKKFTVTYYVTKINQWYSDLEE